MTIDHLSFEKCLLIVLTYSACGCAFWKGVYHGIYTLIFTLIDPFSAMSCHFWENHFDSSNGMKALSGKAFSDSRNHVKSPNYDKNANSNPTRSAKVKAPPRGVL